MPASHQLKLLLRFLARSSDPASELPVGKGVELELCDHAARELEGRHLVTVLLEFLRGVGNTLNLPFSTSQPDSDSVRVPREHRVRVVPRQPADRSSAGPRAVGGRGSSSSLRRSAFRSTSARSGAGRPWTYCSRARADSAAIADDGLSLAQLAFLVAILVIRCLFLPPRGNCELRPRFT